MLGGTPEGADKPISLNGYTYDDGNFYVAGTYLFCREANKIWSRRYAEEGVNAGYICKMFNGTSTNQKTLCSQAIASLKKASQMEENYEVTLKRFPMIYRLEIPCMSLTMTAKCTWKAVPLR